MESIMLWQPYKSACRHLLSEQDRDPYSARLGCFDRRYWGWKLVDYPEATYQRNVYPLAWWLKNDGSLSRDEKEVMVDAVKAGLNYATRIQHADGSFDQAFPNEHSFGATAFLLHPLLEAYRAVREQCSAAEQETIEAGLRKAADFMRLHEEAHGFISNHLAGAALSLYAAMEFFQEPRYGERADDLLTRILDHQSTEGWFSEYDGADPGYQTLCLYYLAQIYQRRGGSRLQDALRSAVEFLAWFVHPDGTFGGEYSSRRTAIYYPGGVALLGHEFPLAASIDRFLLKSILNSRTVTLSDVDMGNMAPLLSNYALALQAGPGRRGKIPDLPWQEGQANKDFPRAGLYIRSTARYYAIVGASNGGVLKIFDRNKGSLLWNDGGYVGQLHGGKHITTQVTELNRPCRVSAEEISLNASFHEMSASAPTSFQLIVLRLMNITVMRNLFLGNLVKGILVRMLIRAGKRAPISLTRSVRFERKSIVIRDVLHATRGVSLQWLEFGRSFVSIHMASAHYFENFSQAPSRFSARQVEVEELKKYGTLEVQTTI
jgi:hypothetical protein